MKMPLEIEKCDCEKTLLRNSNLFLKIGVIIIGLYALFSIWFCMYIGYKSGYEEAVKDFYKGSLKCNIVNEQVVWKK